MPDEYRLHSLHLTSSLPRAFLNPVVDTNHDMINFYDHWLHVISFILSDLEPKLKDTSMHDIGQPWRAGTCSHFKASTHER